MKQTLPVKDIQVKRLASGDYRLSMTVAGRMTEESAEALRSNYKTGIQRIEISEQKKKRTLSSNALAWTLINSLAETMNLPPVQVYRDHIRNIPGVSEAISVSRAGYEAFKDRWEGNGIGWQCEVIEEHPRTVDVMLWYGSSTYDSGQMAKLIDSLIQDCEAVGIPTVQAEPA